MFVNFNQSAGYDLDLELCTSMDEVTEHLILKNVTTPQERINYFVRYMGMLGRECYGEISQEAQANILKELFITRKWKTMTGKR